MINKQLLNKIREQINPLLQDLNKGNKEFNLQLGNCTYNADTATFKLEVRSVGTSGEIVTKELADLRFYARNNFDGFKDDTNDIENPSKELVDAAEEALYLATQERAEEKATEMVE